MRYELKTIGVWAFIRIAFVLNLLAGFIAGIFCIPFLALFMAAMESAAYLDGLDMAPDEGTLGVLVVGLPVMFSLGAAVMGTLFETLVIVLYNLMARLVGGLEVTLDPVVVAQQLSTPSSPPPPPRPETPPPPPPSNRTPDQNLEKP